jgi:hypothetical protein
MLFDYAAQKPTASGTTKPTASGTTKTNRLRHHKTNRIRHHKNQLRPAPQKPNALGAKKRIEPG